MKRLRRTGLPRDSSDSQDHHLDDERIDDEPAEIRSARRPREIKLQEGARRSAGKPGTEKVWQVPLIIDSNTFRVIVPEPVELRYPQSMVVEPARLGAGSHEVSLTLSVAVAHSGAVVEGTVQVVGSRILEIPVRIVVPIDPRRHEESRAWQAEESARDASPQTTTQVVSTVQCRSWIRRLFGL